MRHVRSNLQKVQEIMRSQGCPCWLMHCAEHSDPYFARIITSRTTAPAVAVVGPDACFVMVHTLDADNLKPSKEVHVLRHNDEATLWQNIGCSLERLGFPRRVAFTYSIMGDVQVDVIGAGTYGILTKKLRHLYSDRKQRVTFCSAEEIIYAFADRKDAKDIERMRLVARRALEILESAFKCLQPGMSEIQARDLVHSIMTRKPSYFRRFGVISEEGAWESEDCPIVLAGTSLKKGGHAMPSRRKIRPGDTVYFDFGVQLVFDDESKWSSDIQRMGYVLKAGETHAPSRVQQMFQTLVDAISLGMEQIRPGMRGYQVDEIVRKHIVNAGYPDYNHATGHPIGENAHNPGTLLGPKSRRLSALQVQPNAVYSMEPRIAIVNGGSVEEMVLVTDHGGVPLCTPQKSLYLVYS